MHEDVPAGGRAPRPGVHRPSGSGTGGPEILGSDGPAVAGQAARRACPPVHADDVLVPVSVALDRAHLGAVVDVDEAEALVVAVHPFEFVPGVHDSAVELERAAC